MKKAYDGLFITFEGGDGAGKSTLALQLCKELTAKGFSVLCTREPGGTPLGEKIRELLLNPKGEFSISEKAELLLFLTARAQHVEEKILPALRHGSIILCDRFNDSTIAYQGCARHLGMAYVENLCNDICKIEPDCTLLLDIDPELGFQRVSHSRKQESDRLEIEKLQFHKEVRQGYLHLADKYPERIKVINGALSEDEVFKESLKVILPLLKIKV